MGASSGADVAGAEAASEEGEEGSTSSSARPRSRTDGSARRARGRRSETGEVSAATRPTEAVDVDVGARGVRLGRPVARRLVRLRPWRRLLRNE